MAENEPFQEERRSHGPGFRLGLLIGLLAGVAAAVLFAPPTGEGESRGESAQAAPSSTPQYDIDTPMGRAMSLVEQIRSRMQEASREAEIAAKEAEELALARYAELTRSESASDDD